MRTSWPRCLLAVALGGALLPGAGAGAAPGTAAPPAHPCVELAASPDFARDGTAFCAGEVADPESLTVTAVVVFATRDGGRSWRQATAAGLVFQPATKGSVLGDLLVSPRYATDRTVFVRLSRSLFASDDAGATFRLVAPLVGGRLTAFAAAVPGVGERTMILRAAPGGAPGANQSALLDPVTGDGPRRHARLYGCDAVFTCARPLHGWSDVFFDRIWLAPDFTTSRTMFVSVEPQARIGTRTLWRSTDGGVTFHRWTAAERLGGTDASVAFGLAGVPGTNLLYARVSGHQDLPYEQLFLSRDRGATWARVAYGRAPYQPGPRGTMPQNRPPQIGGGLPAGMVVATRNGRVFTLGVSGDPRAWYESLFCTSDGGRTWARLCR